LVTLLFLITALGKKINEPFTKEKKKENEVALLDLPLQPIIKAQNLNYGDLISYEYRTPMASYAQVTNNKIWTTPENGSALFPPINGNSLYHIS
jgi:hypothetical protein